MEAQQDQSFAMKILKFLFGALVASLTLSIAGMELFGWLLALCSFGLVFLNLRKSSKGESFLAGRKSLALGPDWALWTLWVVATIGVTINGNDKTDYVDVIGNFRWIILLYGYYLAWSLVRPTYFKWLFWRVFAPLLLLVSIYGIVQTFTGIDLIRQGREVHSLTLAQVQLYRASGFFNNPMTFAHLFVMWFCVVLSLIWLGGEEMTSVGGRAWLNFKQRSFLILLAGVIGIALLCSLIRGVWISGTVATLVMLWLWRRRAFYRGAMALAIAGLLAFATLPPFRARVSSIFSTQNIENRDRITLWTANWEIFKDHPIVGIGYTENERRIEEYYDRMGVVKGFHGHAHNVY
ncbi:MAG: O-antigen ligase family protein, partial [Bdellovibrionales bacterium]|nr:O-antigen ligase family protein [Bdellovibrionales bacterium]